MVFSFSRLTDGASTTEQRKLREVRAIFVKHFPDTPGFMEKLVELLRSRREQPFELLLRTAEDGAGRVRAFAVVYCWPKLRAAYLDFIVADDLKPSRTGAGGALYEVIREDLALRGITGLYMDVPPDDAERVSDPARLPVNKKRLAFYERYGARPIVNTLYDGPPPLGQKYDPPFLVFDGLGRPGLPSRDTVREVIRAVLVGKYGWDKSDPHTQKIVRSVVDDPVQLRAPQYKGTASTVKPTYTHTSPLQVVISPHHEIHHVRERGYVERPARVEAILAGLAEFAPKRTEVTHVGTDLIEAVHDKDLVRYVERMAAKLKPDETLYPYVFPIRRPDRKPKEHWVRAGYYCIDTFTPLSRSAIAAARGAVDCAVSGAMLIEKGERYVYSVCRPPGHHAERRVFGGFCYFNNAAIAAHRLAQRGRVAFLDIDYHHGNGSQDVFWERSDVVFASIHGHPSEAYPYFSGFTDEIGVGEGKGFNRNFPLKEGVDDKRYLVVLEEAIAYLMRHKPWVLVVSLGFDIMKGDPTGAFVITPTGMEAIGRAIRAVDLPTLVVQEGGYSLRNLHSGARKFFTGLLTATD